MQIVVRKRPFAPDALRYDAQAHAVCAESAEKHHCRAVPLPPAARFVDETVTNAQLYARLVAGDGGSGKEAGAGGGRRPPAVVVYGQTGAGKTHTLEGLLREHGRSRLAVAAPAPAPAPGLELSALEIYNEKIWDVLARPVPAPVRLRAGRCRPEPRRAPVRGPQDFRALLRHVQRARFSGQSKLNAHSSRSHLIYTLYEKGQTHGTLFVDLAGNEKARFSYCHREAAHINQSLFAFKECLRALDGGGGPAAHVPFRRSQLTRLLRPLFTDRAHRLIFIATLHPAPTCITDTYDTLRYVQALARCAPAPRPQPPSVSRHRGPPLPPRAHRRVRPRDPPPAETASQSQKRKAYMDTMLKGILSLNYYMQVEYHVYKNMRRPGATPEDWERHRQSRNANLRKMAIAIARQHSLPV